MVVKVFRPDPTKGKKLVNALFRNGLALPVMLLLLLGVGCRDSNPEGASGLPAATDSTQADFDRIENGIHVRTGFVAADGLMTVVQNCTPCHSAKLVTQNRMTREGWEATIRWMQNTQNLWDLGVNEKVILDYLATHYAPENKGRRENLKDIEWYELEP